MRTGVAAALICGDAPQQSVRAAVESLQGYVDHIYIAFNGKRFPFSLKECDDLNVVFAHFEWEDDFAKARNQAFDMVPRDRYDWLLWIDTDDLLVVPGGRDAWVSMLNKNKEDDLDGVFLNYEYLVEDDVVLIEHYRERLLRADREWRWEYPIHENCVGRPGYRYSKETTAHVRHTRTRDQERTRVNSERNRRILVKARREHPDVPRFTYYLAREVHAEAHGMEDSHERDSVARSAIMLFEQFIRESDFDEDSYLANYEMADCYRLIGDTNKSIDTDLQGVKLFPHWPHSYLGLAQAFLAAGDYEKVRHWSDVCLTYAATPPPSLQVQESLSYTFTPRLLRAIGRQHTGDIEGAIEDLETALQSQPNNTVIAEKLAELRDGGPESRPSRPRRRGKDPNEKSVAFIVPPALEPWHPEIESRTGAGGSEQAVMKLAPIFRGLGYRTVVFGTPGDLEGEDADGVEWYDVSGWTPRDPFQNVIVSRSPVPLDAKIGAERIFYWMHDMAIGPELTSGRWGNRLDQVDKVLTLTDWHMRTVQSLYDIPPVKLGVMPNGIVPSLYDDAEKVKKDPRRIIWSSSPDRGLDCLFMYWHDIRRILPEAELHIYYGWEMIDRVIAQGTSQSRWLMNFKAAMMEELDRIEDHGIFWHGRVPQAELAKAQMESTYWLYPTYFCVSGDTLVDMPRDYSKDPLGVPISRLVGKTDVPVYTFNEQTEQYELKKMKRCWKVGRRKVVKVTWDDGTALRCTPDHRVLTYDRGWVQAQDLLPGESVRALKKHMQVQVGIGNYGRGKSWPKEHVLIAKHLFGEIPDGCQVDHIDGNAWNNSPENLQLLSRADHAKKTFTGRKQSRRQIEARIEASRKWREENPEEVSRLRREAARARWNHKVVSVEVVGEEDVYDMEVEDNHNFVAGGVVVHNCETYCITALEAQAAGVIPVTNRLAGLTETVLHDDHTVYGYPNNVTFREQFLDLFGQMVHMPEELRERRKKIARKWALSHSWDAAADRWERLFR